ncbi:MAG: guanylate kinase [Candidatus Omnitrophota bacterium]
MREKKAKIFVISGPSGSGKTTLLQHVLKDAALRKKLARSISFTTRHKRSGERNGKDYFFIGEKQFKALQKAKKILEWTKYLGYYYATPKELIDKQLKAGKHVALCLDVKGASLVKRLYPGNAVTIFVLPPSLEVLHQRIRNRCNKTKTKEIKQRVVLAKKELSAASNYDHCLLNQDLVTVTKELKAIINNELETNGKGR